MGGIDGYLPVSTSREGRSRRTSSHLSGSRKTQSNDLKLCFTICCCCTVFIVAGVVAGALSRSYSFNGVSKATPEFINSLSNQMLDAFSSSTLKNNVTALQASAEESAKNVKQLEADLAQLKHDNQVIEERMKSLEDKLDTFGTVYDGSVVGNAVRDNIENYYLKSTTRWVTACAWENCRYQHFDQVVAEVIGSVQKELKKDKLNVVQLGYCTTSFLKSSTSGENKKFTKLRIVDKFSEGSPASFSKCRPNTISKGKYRDIEDLEAEKKSLLADGVLEVVAEDSLHSLQSNSVDLIFIDHMFSDVELKLDAVIHEAFEKLHIGGVIIGHSYAVVSPAQKASGSEISFPVYWNSASGSNDPSFFLTEEEVRKTKSAVDSFIVHSRDEMLGSGGAVKIAGDTTWIVHRQKVTLKDILGGG